MCVCALCVLEVGLKKSESVSELEAKRWRSFQGKEKLSRRGAPALEPQRGLIRVREVHGHGHGHIHLSWHIAQGHVWVPGGRHTTFLKRPGFHAAQGPDARSNE